MRWGPWEQAWSSSQSSAGLGELEAVYLEGAPPECRVMAAFASVHQGPSPRRGGGLEEEEGGDPSALGGVVEACLCGEMLPRGEKQRWRELI